MWRRNYLWIFLPIACGWFAHSLNAQAPSPDPRHVVVVVWDGMRPDMMTEKNCPVLWRLAQEGVFFRNHHAVYPTATNVNGTALVTGFYPARSGIIANHEYRPAIDWRGVVDVSEAAVVRKGDEAAAGKYLAVPTIAELVRAAGGRTVTASAKTIGLLLDRHLDAARDKGSAALFSGAMQSPENLAAIVSQLGPFPRLSFAEKDLWTTKALTEIFWKENLPVFSLLWLSEPDGTQHEAAPGSPAALAAIKSSDDNLERVLHALDRHKATPNTDVFVVSDHGFSTIGRSIDLRKILKDAGFDAVTQFATERKPGQIMLAGNGGTVFFYVIGHDGAVTARLVEFLQQADFTGVIFTRDKLPGTFGLDAANILDEQAPDVAMAFRWNENKNQFGLPGMIDADSQRAAGNGTHVTLSKFDVHNTLIAVGPDFRRGATDDLPSGNVDLVPTILRILGITPPRPLEGRVLSEALNNMHNTAARAEVETVEAKRELPAGTWRQSLRTSRIGGNVYLDQGNGEYARREKQP
ncbi:MAG: alkaline phosphatase family protein [Chthoniobacterales bacterium]